MSSSETAESSAPPGYDVPKDLFAKKCVNLCHDSTEPDGELDLEKTGVVRAVDRRRRPAMTTVPAAC